MELTFCLMQNIFVWDIFSQSECRLTPKVSQSRLCRHWCIYEYPSIPINTNWSIKILKKICLIWWQKTFFITLLCNATTGASGSYGVISICIQDQDPDSEMTISKSQHISVLLLFLFTSSLAHSIFHFICKNKIYEIQLKQVLYLFE